MHFDRYCDSGPESAYSSLVLFMNLLVPPTIIHPRKSLVTKRTLIWSIPIVTSLMPVEIDLPREVLATDMTREPRRSRRMLTAQRLENRRTLGQLGMVDANVTILVLVCREADGCRVAAHGARERPVVPVFVTFTGCLCVPANVEVAAESTTTFEKI